MDTKQKYIRTRINQILIFPVSIQHDEFRSLEPVSAGFCYVNSDHVQCFGESVSLGLKSIQEIDSYHATKQLFGIDYAEKLLK